MAKPALALIATATVAALQVPPAFSQDFQSIPKLAARVTDLTGTLTAEQQSSLDDKLAAFEARKGSQVAVLIVATTEPEDIAQYSIRVVEQWKLGRQAIDDGALLIVAKNDRELRIEVGRALEGALTDLTANRIISQTIVPLFRQGDFYGGINAGVDQVMRVIDGEPLPPPDARWRGNSARGVSHLVPFLFVAVFFGSVVLRSLFGRGLSAVIAGAVTGAVVYFVAQTLLMALLAGLIAFLFALLTGYSGGGTWSSYPRAGGWGGGFGRGSTGGFTGGGGFSGGGGGFNGGGASGRW